MPEGPEVKIIQLRLSKFLKNKTLLDIKILSGRYKIHKSPKNYDLFKSSIPSKVINVFCKGKFIYIWFENKFYLWNTLGMTGTWSTKKTVHSRVHFKFKSFNLYFNDMRNFGTIKFSFNPKSIQDKLTLIGPDILQLDTNIDFLFSRLKKTKSKKTIGELLLNQSLIAGVGNYLRADILWYAKLSPFRKIKSLTLKDWKQLYDSIIQITWFHYNFAKGIKLKKITDIKFFNKHIDVDFFVYQKKEDIYGNPVIREFLDTRSIHWCPKFQK